MQRQCSRDQQKTTVATKRYANEFAFFLLCYETTPKETHLCLSVCFQIWSNVPPSLNEQSSIIWFLIFLKQSQTWTHPIEKMTQLWEVHFPLQVYPGANHFKAEKVWMWQLIWKDMFTAEGDLSIPDNSVYGASCVFSRVDGSLPDLAVSLRPFWLDRHVARAAEPRGTAGSRHSGHVAYITVRWLGRQVVWAPWISAWALQRGRQYMKTVRVDSQEHSLKLNTNSNKWGNGLNTKCKQTTAPMPLTIKGKPVLSEISSAEVGRWMWVMLIYKLKLDVRGTEKERWGWCCYVRQIWCASRKVTMWLKYIWDVESLKIHSCGLNLVITQCEMLRRKIKQQCLCFWIPWWFRLFPERKFIRLNNNLIKNWGQQVSDSSCWHLLHHLSAEPEAEMRMTTTVWEVLFLCPSFQRARFYFSLVSTWFYMRIRSNEILLKYWTAGLNSRSSVWQQDRATNSIPLDSGSF